MKGADVHNMKDDELLERLRQTREEQFSLRFQHATGELENSSRLGEVRRDLARMLTVARERGIDLGKELQPVSEE